MQTVVSPINVAIQMPVTRQMHHKLVQCMQLHSCQSQNEPPVNLFNTDTQMILTGQGQPLISTASAVSLLCQLNKFNHLSVVNKDQLDAGLLPVI